MAPEAPNINNSRRKIVNLAPEGQNKVADTFTQLYIHVVFAVKGRESLINTEWKDKLYRYISGIIANQNQKLYIINGMPDHVHLLISMKPDKTLSDLVREIKEHSTKYINGQGLVIGKFQWQNGFGAFSVSQSGVDRVIDYIKGQEEHHSKRTFREEYLELLEKFKIEFQEKYIFEELI